MLAMDSRSPATASNSLSDNPSAKKLKAIEEILEESEYLERIGAWSAAVGPEVRKRLTSKMIKRNDVIWELCKGERGYLRHLVVMWEFRDRWPQNFERKEDIFPDWEELTSAHATYLQLLIREHHGQENFVVERLAPILMAALSEERGEQFSHMYGRLLALQNVMKSRLERHSRDPNFAAYLRECENHRFIGRKKLEDCFMVIYQRWTKVETQIQAIVDNTLNDQIEAEQLERVREQVRSILRRAESVLALQQNARQLDHYRRNFDVSKEELDRGGYWDEGGFGGAASAEASLRSPMGPTGASLQESVKVALEMWRKQAELRHFSKISVLFHVRGKAREGHAVLVNNLFFILEEVIDNSTRPPRLRFRLLMPSENDVVEFKAKPAPVLVRFGEVQGFFREMNESRATSQGQGHKYHFLVILMEKTDSRMVHFHCDTPDERTRWKGLLEAGFLQYLDKQKGERLDQRLQTNTIAREKFERVLTDLEQIDEDIGEMCTVRRWFFQALFFDFPYYSSSTADNSGGTLRAKQIPEITEDSTEEVAKRLAQVLSKLEGAEDAPKVFEFSQDWVDHWLQHLRRLKFLLGEGLVSGEGQPLGAGTTDKPQQAGLRGGPVERSRSAVGDNNGRSTPVLRKTETFPARSNADNDKVQPQSPNQQQSDNSIKRSSNSTFRKNMNQIFTLKRKTASENVSSLQHKSSNSSTKSGNSDYWSTSETSGDPSLLPSFENTSMTESRDGDDLQDYSATSDMPDLVSTLSEMHKAGGITLSVVTQLQSRYIALLRRHQLQQEELRALQQYRQDTEAHMQTLANASAASQQHSAGSNHMIGPSFRKLRVPGEGGSGRVSLGSAGHSTSLTAVNMLPANSSPRVSDRISLSEISDVTMHETSGVLHASAQSTERLRIRILEFNKEKEEWLKESKRERISLEKAKEDFLAEKNKFDAEVDKLQKEKQKLQHIIDMHNQRLGLDLLAEMQQMEQTPNPKPSPNSVFFPGGVTVTPSQGGGSMSEYEYCSPHLLPRESYAPPPSGQTSLTLPRPARGRHEAHSLTGYPSEVEEVKPPTMRIAPPQFPASLHKSQSESRVPSATPTPPTWQGSFDRQINSGTRGNPSLAPPMNSQHPGPPSPQQPQLLRKLESVPAASGQQPGSRAAQIVANRSQQPQQQMLPTHLATSSKVVKKSK